MKTLIVIISFALVSCIKVSTGEGNLQLREVDKALIQKSEIRQSKDFWEAMQNLDLEFAEQFSDSSQEKEFAQVVRSIMDGDYANAEAPLENLVKTSSDSLFIENSGRLLTGIYLRTYQWQKLIDLDESLPKGIDDMGTIDMVKAWQQQEPEVIHYPQNPLVVPSEKSMSGVPMIQVMVNGIEQTFWIDTGAEFTVLASDIAEKCGVKPLTDIPSRVGTATDKKIGLWAGSIENLKIQDLLIENHPVFIIGKVDLEFRILKIFKILKIDGIIGWNAIQNLKIELNYANDSVTFNKPKLEDAGTRNFHYLTQPFVTVLDTTGTALHFFMDTGANTSSLYDPAYSVFDTSAAEIKNAMVGGAGGFQRITQLRLEKQSLVLGNTRINFSALDGKTPLGELDEGFILYDGMLGSDVAQEGVLILDFQNGWCELKTVQN